jgi:hypothetical protein
MSMIEDGGTPGGRLVLTAEQYALITTPAVRATVIRYVPEAVMLVQPAEYDGLYVYDDHRLRGDEVDTILYLLDNPSVLDAIAAEVPDEEPA